mmetsp:Transcript_20692/g.19715  ORF Transcript_20692/g.19715 Transcript_20692/m.19715 type:complete len:274 (+) Transcript_20692:3303-4124(+)
MLGQLIQDPFDLGHVINHLDFSAGDVFNDKFLGLAYVGAGSTLIEAFGGVQRLLQGEVPLLDGPHLQGVLQLGRRVQVHHNDHQLELREQVGLERDLPLLVGLLVEEAEGSLLKEVLVLTDLRSPSSPLPGSPGRDGRSVGVAPRLARLLFPSVFFSSFQLFLVHDCAFGEVLFEEEARDLEGVAGGALGVLAVEHVAVLVPHLPVREVDVLPLREPKNSLCEPILHDPCQSLIPFICDGRLELDGLEVDAGVLGEIGQLDLDLALAVLGFFH